MATTEAVELKCVVVGDCNVGKTCLIVSYTDKTFTPQHKPGKPNVISSRYAEMDVAGKKLMLLIADTSGSGESYELRNRSYSGAHVFIICYSINSEQSRNNATEKWSLEIRKNHPSVPIILAGTQSQLVKDQATLDGFRIGGKEILPFVSGYWSGYKYVECSAEIGETLEELFVTAAKAALDFKENTEQQSLLESMISTVGKYF